MQRLLVRVGCGLLISLVLAGLAVKIYDHNRIRPGVRLGDVALGGLTKAQATDRLSRRLADYRLELTVADKSVTYRPADLGVVYDLPATIAAAYHAGRDGQPRNNRDISFVYHQDLAKTDTALAGLAMAVGVAPVDATVAVENGTPTVIPGHSGRGVSESDLRQALTVSLRLATSPPIVVQPRPQAPALTASTVAPAVTTAEQLMAVPITLTTGTSSFTPRPADIASWLDFTPAADGLAQLNVVPDDTKLAAYAQTIAAKVDIAPISQRNTNENGVTRVDSAGTNGSGINQAGLVAALKSALTSRQPLVYALVINPVAFKTVTNTVVTLALGRYVEVNTTTQQLTVWQDHQAIYESGVTTGAAKYGLGTDSGLFAIYAKQTNRYLDGCWHGSCYHLHVNYWMPFNQGDGLHDAYWRNGIFGTPDYYYNGSHGCVNLSEATAEFLWNWTTVGTPVWVHT